MYSQEDKTKLMEELKEMESLKVDMGDEGKILQEDLIKFFTQKTGDESDLISRLEMYFYGFKLFCRKSVKIDKNQFIIYLNDSNLDWEKIYLVKNELTKFELVIEAVRENKDVLINLNFTFHF